MVRAAVALAAVAVGFGWCSMASAQMPGSYLDSCRRVSQSGPVLNAECRGAGDRYYSTTIDTRRCRGTPVANTFGRLTCGGVQGSASQVRGGDYDDDQDQPQGYGNQDYGDDDDAPRPRYGYGYPPPRRPSYGYGYVPPPPPPPYEDDDGDD